MKFEDGPLKSYLVKNLQPLTAADPALLANYVAALLKNNKPKPELQTLCVDKLFDFLGDGTKQFVTQLFKDIEDGTLVEVPEDSVSPAAPPAGDATTEVKSSPTPVTRTIPSAIQTNDDGDESSDDEDDDRNHKHRRRISRSRSFDKDAEENERSHHRKRSRSTENGHYRDNHRHYDHRRSYRGRDGLASRIVVDGAVHGGGMRGGLPFRDAGGPRFFGPGLQRNMAGNGGRGWLPPDQRFAGGFPPDFPPALLAQGPSTSNIFPGRVPGGRGGPPPQPPWGNFGLLENGSLEVIPLNPRGSNPMAMISRTRCLDFEERGYCLRGDLCPMEHGANRIVVEDVQSLSKLTLPIGNARNGTSSGPPEKVARTNRESLGGEDGNPASTVSDSYDPDQPLWGGKDPSDKVRHYNSERQWDNGSDPREVGVDDKTGDNTSKSLEPGVSVWDRIGPVDGEKGSVKRPKLSGAEEGNGHMANNGGVQAEKHSHSQRTAAGTSYGGTDGRDDRTEKAQRTLYVRCIPTDSNKADILKGHFQKFGKVLDIRIPTMWKDRAFVQFYERESALAALASPEAVLGNRFIQLDWANRDNRVHPHPYDYHRSKPGAPATGKEVPNGTTATPGTPAPEAKMPATNGMALQAQKKQEELEQMKEEIRKKQEALAAKRNEFKRKLDKLAKQGVTLPASESDAQDTEDTNSSTLPAAAKSPKSPFPRPGQQFNSAATPPWGPSRYKLDNRTTVFRITSPPPSALSDIVALKAHFGTYGEVSDLEVVEEGSAAQVSFATRRDAEKAFAQGKSWQGQPLQFAWVNNPTPSSTIAPPPSSSSNFSPSIAQQDATVGIEGTV
ncbi:hypothetical protein SELMODRAFT_437689 [Selaginella moellendorffii]|uniref:C3H1-type domain-containing protein n=1 Tax=Selaginella moellendorffii TaxID=88036 RepID=D8QNW4_SELML|nr:zinc finger CCCH domain-containing protein 27 [Selaginella moellendorffii]EFJ38181.1 hypothetical protein SELMODRAFT_437689 [Selaginella moellendorffii]|eukprot:XP_002960642.1 zinc finger CCCH domain-containing protein 27 [Selaginella moellendorffii]